MGPKEDTIFVSTNKPNLPLKKRWKHQTLSSASVSSSYSTFTSVSVMALTVTPSLTPTASTSAASDASEVTAIAEALSFLSDPDYHCPKAIPSQIEEQELPPKFIAFSSSEDTFILASRNLTPPLNFDFIAHYLGRGLSSREVQRQFKLLLTKQGQNNDGNVVTSFYDGRERGKERRAAANKRNLIQCQRCSRWRCIPRHITVVYGTHWVCSMNRWSDVYNSCEADEEAIRGDDVVINGKRSKRGRRGEGGGGGGGGIGIAVKYSHR